MLERQFLIGVYDSERGAQRALEAVLEAGYPMDRVAVLGKLQHGGDDVLGVVYPAVGQRMRVWASHGALWGGLLGALAAVTGGFLVPGVGAPAAFGPLVDALAGAATGAALGGGALAGAAALSQVSVALHRAGIPDSAIEGLQALVASGATLVVLQADLDDALDSYRPRLARGQPRRTLHFPEHLKA